MSLRYDDGRVSTAPGERNRDPILAVLKDVLPARGLVLEIASGYGFHAAHFVAHLPPGLVWQPSEPELEKHESILAWRSHLGAPANFLPPLSLDVHADPWPLERADAVVCINMIHASPWSTCLSLMRGAGRVLAGASPGLLLLYGPFVIDGRYTSPSDEAFDRDLRARDPSWGIRSLDEVTRAAAEHGLTLRERRPMPANNFVLVFTRGERA